MPGDIKMMTISSPDVTFVMDQIQKYKEEGKKLLGDGREKSNVFPLIWDRMTQFYNSGKNVQSGIKMV